MSKNSGNWLSLLAVAVVAMLIVDLAAAGRILGRRDRARERATSVVPAAAIEGSAWSPSTSSQIGSRPWPEPAVVRQLPEIAPSLPPSQTVAAVGEQPRKRPRDARAVAAALRRYKTDGLIDEIAFERLKLPESDQEAIRRLRRPRPWLAEHEAAAAGPEREREEEERRAVDQILGADGANRLEAARVQARTELAQRAGQPNPQPDSVEGGGPPSAPEPDGQAAAAAPLSRGGETHDASAVSSPPD